MKISQDENFVNTSKKTPEKQKLKISRGALFHKKTRICLKHFLPD